jgi:hypothetical protein
MAQNKKVFEVLKSMKNEVKSCQETEQQKVWNIEEIGDFLPSACVKLKVQEEEERRRRRSEREQKEEEKHLEETVSG